MSDKVRLNLLVAGEYRAMLERLRDDTGVASITAVKGALYFRDKSGKETPIWIP